MRKFSLVLAAAAVVVALAVSGSAFSETEMKTKWNILLKEVSVPAEKCGEALDEGNRSIYSYKDLIKVLQTNDRFWYDGLVWEIKVFRDFLQCTAYKPLWSKAEKVDDWTR